MSGWEIEYGLIEDRTSTGHGPRLAHTLRGLRGEDDARRRKFYMEKHGHPYPIEIKQRRVFTGEWETLGTVFLCCDSHNVHCEPPSELCCEHCGEVDHPKHAPGVVCVLDAARAAEGSGTPEADHE